MAIVNLFVSVDHEHEMSAKTVQVERNSKMQVTMLTVRMALQMDTKLLQLVTNMSAFLFQY